LGAGTAAATAVAASAVLAAVAADESLAVEVLAAFLGVLTDLPPALLPPGDAAPAVAVFFAPVPRWPVCAGSRAEDWSSPAMAARLSLFVSGATLAVVGVELADVAAVCVVVAWDSAAASEGEPSCPVAGDVPAVWSLDASVAPPLGEDASAAGGDPAEDPWESAP
jgi:hypothetical protein